MDNKKKIIISIILIILMIILITIYIINTNEKEEIDLNIILLENSEEENVEITNEIHEEEKIAVHIIGEVKKEGIIYLEEGSRVADAIEKAGGETKEADLSKINLAYILQDGEKIYVPNKNDELTEYITKENGNNLISEGNNTSNNLKGENDKVNIKNSNFK